jgi:glycosyltransferase involved in cell wall biosynthesis
MKKTILHFIYDLGRGGAETMMVRVIRELQEYNNIVVTLYEDNHFGRELQCTKYICLNQGSLLLFPLSALKLRKIIKTHKVDIVHTHLFWPTMIARIGTPKNVVLITTIHAFIATSVEYKHWHIRLLDKISYNFRKSIIIGVAKGAVTEYFSFLKIRSYKAFALYTFVDIDRFQFNGSAIDKEDRAFRLISIGALRVQKNHQYLIEAFKLLKNENIELHIFGIGPLQQSLQEAIEKNNVKVVLKGQVRNIHEILPQYDLFVMSSTFEGFSLGVLESMAMKVPMLLSEIVSFREQCEDTAVYFNLNDANDFVIKLKTVAANKGLRLQLAEKAYDRVIENFTLQHHMRQLRNIYSESLNNN